MLCRVRLVYCRRARCQGVIAESRCLEPFPALRGVPSRRVRPRRGRLPASYHVRQGAMCRVEVFGHLVHSGRGHEPVGLLLCGAQPGRQGGLILRGRDRCPQAALDGRGLGVVRQEAALRVAVGGRHRRVPCRVEEAWQSRSPGGVPCRGPRRSPAGAYPPRRPPNAWSPGLPVPPGPC